MRAIVGMFGLVCSVIIIALVARYGYKTSDTEIDGLITAFLFAVITAGGLGGHAVAIRLWRRSAVYAIIIGLISASALVVNLTNSIGAIAGRGDERTAERVRNAQAIKDYRAELARLIHEREILPAFQATTAEAVQFARDAVAAAERTTKAECEKRRPRCRDRETDEVARRTELAQVSSHRAATERAAKLDAEMAALRSRLATAAPVGTINPQAAALVQLFRLPDSYASAAAYYQYLAISVVVELLIAGSFIAFELMRPDARPTTVTAPATPMAEVSEPEITPIRPRLAPPATPRKQAVAVLDHKRVGSVVDYIAEQTEPAAETRAIGVQEIHHHYCAWCLAGGKGAYAFDDFVRELDRLREEDPLKDQVRKFGNRYFGIAIVDRSSRGKRRRSV